MKRIILFLLVILTPLLLTACSEEKNNIATGHAVQYESTKDSIQNSVEINSFSVKDIPSDKMRACFGKNYPKYTYIIYSGKAYQKVEHENGAFDEMVVTKKQICHNDKPNDSGWRCFELNPGDYINAYYAIASSTEEPQKTMFKLDCTNIEYDESVFLI